MKKLIILILLVGIAGNVFGGVYGGGSGTEEEPYLISDPNHMQEIGTNVGDWGSHFLLTNDIDLSRFSGTEFNVIGNDSGLFSGVFDGNGYTISNFIYDPNEAINIGMFGALDGTLKNITLIACIVNGGTEPYRIGSLAGYSSGTIINCHTSGIVTGHKQVGGLVGKNRGTVIGCSSNIEITAVGSGQMKSGSEYVGGLIAGNFYGLVYDCSSAGIVTGVDISNVGGLVGYNHNDSIIENCSSSTDVTGAGRVGGLVGYNFEAVRRSYSTGDVSFGSNVGGLVGYNYFGIIEDCYSNSNVSGALYRGGLVGESDYGSIKNSFSTGSILGGGLVGIGIGDVIIDSFWDIETSGQSTSYGGTGKTTAEMKLPSTFTNWDFIETWGIEDNQTYPFLKLTYPVGDLDLSKDVNLVDLSIFALHWLDNYN